MIAYFGTSALLPLIVEEPGSLPAARAWDVAQHVVSVRLVYAEARAALAHANRQGRLPPGGLTSAVDALDDLYEQLDLVDASDSLVRRAGDLAERHALRGSDAIHLAGAERLGDEAAVLVAGDRQLCAAAYQLGLAVADTSTGSQG